MFTGIEVYTGDLLPFQQKYAEEILQEVHNKGRFQLKHRDDNEKEDFVISYSEYDEDVNHWDGEWSSVSFYKDIPLSDLVTYAANWAIIYGRDNKDEIHDHDEARQRLLKIASHLEEQVKVLKELAKQDNAKLDTINESIDLDTILLM